MSRALISSLTDRDGIPLVVAAGVNTFWPEHSDRAFVTWVFQNIG